MSVDLHECTVLGGCGYPFHPGERLTARFGPASVSLEVTHRDIAVDVAYPEIVDLSITGPGAVTTGGGFIGGGFGFQGALEGLVIAGVLNALTTQTKVHTFMQVITHHGELFLHYDRLEPGALRIALSPIFTALRHMDPDWVDGRRRRLHALASQNVLTEAECAQLLATLTSAPAIRELVREPRSARNPNSLKTGQRVTTRSGLGWIETLAGSGKAVVSLESGGTIVVDLNDLQPDDGSADAQ